MIISFSENSSSSDDDSDSESDYHSAASSISASSSRSSSPLPSTSTSQLYLHLLGPDGKLTAEERAQGIAEDIVVTVNILLLTVQNYKQFQQQDLPIINNQSVSPYIAFASIPLFNLCCPFLSICYQSANLYAIHGFHTFNQLQQFFADFLLTREFRSMNFYVYSTQVLFKSLDTRGFQS